jgi:hypothetical protein
MNTLRPLVDVNGNYVEPNRYYILRANGSNAPYNGHIHGATWLIKRVAPLRNDPNSPVWERSNSAYFDFQGHEVSVNNSTHTFSPVVPGGTHKVKNKRTKVRKHKRTKKLRK